MDFEIPISDLAQTMIVTSLISTIATQEMYLYTDWNAKLVPECSH